MSIDTSAPFIDPSHTAAWIEDDALLRDEAVLCGWASARAMEARVDTIRAYYRQKSEAMLRQRASLSEHDTSLGRLLGELAGEIAAAEQRISAEEAAAEVACAARRETHDLLRCGVGVALGALICVFNYRVIYELLGGGAGELATASDTGPFATTWVVALGVMFLGMFALFAPGSVFFRRPRDGSDGDTAEAGTGAGKVWIAELVPAVAAALFTAIWGDEPSLLHTLSSFVFVLALFMFGGKLLLSLLPELTAAVKQWRNHRSTLRQLEAHRASHQRLLQLRVDQHGARFDIAAAFRRLPSREELMETCERKVNLYLSEVAFARAATAGIDEHAEPAHVFAGGEDR